MLRPLPGPRRSLNFFDIAYLNNAGCSCPIQVFEPGFAALALKPRSAIVAVGHRASLDETSGIGGELGRH